MKILVKKTKTPQQKGLMKRLLHYINGHVKSFVIAFFLMVIVVGLDTSLPIFTGKIVDELGKDVIIFSVVLLYIILYAIFMIVEYIIQYIQSISLQKVGQEIMYTIREDVFRTIETFSNEQLNVIPVGKLVTRVTSDTNAVNEMYTNIVINLIKNILTIIVVIIIMFVIQWKLALIVLAFAPLLVVVSIIFRKVSRKAYSEVRANVSNINAFLSENLSGMKITQVFNQEKKKFNEFQDRNKQLRKSSMKEIWVFAIFRPIIYVLYITTLILVIYIGCKMALTSGVVTFAIIIIFQQYITKLFDPIQQLADQFNVMQSAFAASERIFEVLDTKPVIVDSPDAVELNNIRGDIEFKHVWFSYIPDEWILKDVSFKINAGDTVAFVGATGSGKTTILSLIVRNYDIQKGEILIDGIDIKHIKIASLRKQIGQMLQDVFLFSGTIFSNIQMREENISLDDVKKASTYVNANHFIDQLPNGYDEEVRERGNNFSSGQRQLLSFARTIVHKPKVMILDEATANIDTETELLIQDSLEKMKNIGTMLIVAHRLSTIQHADNIIVMQKGTIIEEGNHQELLKLHGYYYKLYRLQYESNLKNNQ